MARNHTPFVGRPFNQPVTHNQLNDQFRATENSQAISVAPPLTIENTLGGGTRIGINLQQPEPVVPAVDSVKAIGQVIVVPNDQVEEDQPTGDSEAVVVRRLTEPDPYTGRMRAGEAIIMKTWWPLKNSDYEGVRYLPPLEADDLLDPSQLPILLAAFDVSGGFRAYSASSGVATQQFRILFLPIISEAIKCRTWDGSTEGGDIIRVARPYFLQGGRAWNNVVRNGVTYSNYRGFSDQIRTATKEGESETQTIVPAYLPSDILIAARVNTGVTTPQGIIVEWIDLNVDGRMWQVLP